MDFKSKLEEVRQAAAAKFSALVHSQEANELTHAIARLAEAAAEGAIAKFAADKLGPAAPLAQPIVNAVEKAAEAKLDAAIDANVNGPSVGGGDIVKALEALLSQLKGGG